MYCYLWQEHARKYNTFSNQPTTATTTTTKIDKGNSLSKLPQANKCIWYCHITSHSKSHMAEIRLIGYEWKGQWYWISFSAEKGRIRCKIFYRNYKCMALLSRMLIIVFSFLTHYCSSLLENSSCYGNIAHIYGYLFLVNVGWHFRRNGNFLVIARTMSSLWVSNSNIKSHYKKIIFRYDGKTSVATHKREKNLHLPRLNSE